MGEGLSQDILGVGMREKLTETGDLKDRQIPHRLPGPEPRKAVLVSGDLLRAKLAQYDRTPFVDLLAVWMECIPSVDRLEQFAEKYPDRYIRGLVDLGRLAGFADKTQIDMSLTTQIGTLSDSQLEDRLRKAAERLGVPLPNLPMLELKAEPQKEKGDLGEIPPSEP
jgi:hypothetical protein